MWTSDTEIQFFKQALKNFATPEQLFYNIDDKHYAYIPKGVDAHGQTLQSRNTLIGKFTEKWCRDLLFDIARKLNLFAVNSVVCEEIGLTRQSNADLAFCTTDSIEQRAENIKLLFEVKMSITSNYTYEKPNKIKLLGNYTQHKGIPSLLRSDSMLKAIGKAINIRVSGSSATKIPIIVLGNTPISETYIKKVDFLKKSGVIQGFWSLNPSNLKLGAISESPDLGFKTISDLDSLCSFCKDIVSSDINYFSAMLSKNDLGKIIKIASKENNDISRADKFLKLIQG